MSRAGDAIYRALLRAFPRRFREARADEMARLFAQQRQRVAGQPLAIARLSTAARDWHNFAMRVYYRPGSTELSGELVREGPIHLSGDGLSTRSQLALRGVAAKVFPRNRSLSLIPERVAAHPRLKDCEISQFEIQDGWVGVAVGPKRG